MTTDPDEGRRQIEAMQPSRLKVGDRVRLKAGGERVMGVVRLRDYDNFATCQWHDAETHDDLREEFRTHSLVKVEDEGQLQGPGPQGQPSERSEEGHSEPDQGPASARG